MKIITYIIALSLLCLLSSAQKNDKTFKQLAIVNNGDSTLFREKYEINVKRRKIYYITAVWNYLDIKNVKYRTPIKINRKNWIRIRDLINSIDFSKLDPENEKSIGKSMYEIELLNSKKETKIYSVQNDEELKKLKGIFYIIRSLVGIKF